MNFSTTLSFLILVIISLILSAHGANILFYFGLSTYSHRITVWPLVEALADQGHNVTFLQSVKNKNPNPKVTELVVPTRGLRPTEFLNNRLSLGRNAMFFRVHELPHLGFKVCNETLSDPEIVSWINSTNVDLVVIDGLYNDCGLGLAYLWGAQTVVFGTSTAFESWPEEFGYPAESNWIPSIHFGKDMPLSFPDRIRTTFEYLYLRYTKTGILYPKLEQLFKQTFDLPDMPSMSELSANTSLVLMNTHFSEEVARSLPPLVVPIGGMHCTGEVQPLPKKIDDFINAGTDGFIYVSFGSAAQVSTAPRTLQKLFFNVFNNSKIQYIWKWEGVRPKEMASNVYTAKWMPQQDILAHPKCRAFITHGGLLGIQEAVFNAVPMILFPIFAEQDYNAERVHRTKRGIRLEISELTQEDLEDSIDKILNDQIYSNNIKIASKVFKDRPQKPVDTAVWWIEYVLRHKYSNFLRPLSISQTWYQRRSLDVWGSIFSLLLIILVGCLYVCKQVLCHGGNSTASPERFGITRFQGRAIKRQVKIRKQGKKYL